MERTPEPELMDTEEQARAYSEADFTEPHERFVEAFQKRFPDFGGDGVVLDLGCGPADVTVRFARAFPRAYIDAVDGAEMMLSYGRVRVAKEGLEGRVILSHAYLPDDPLPRWKYDVVISNSLLHHLADPTTLWAALKKYGAKGAPVFLMDLKRPANEEAVQALVKEHANEPEVLQRDFQGSLHASYTVDEVKAQLEEHGLSHLKVEAEGERHLTVYGRL